MSKEKAEKVIGLFLGFGSAVRCQSVPHPLVGNLKVPVETRTALRFRCTCSFLFPQVFVWPQITPLALPALTSFRAHLICIGSSTLSMSVCLHTARLPTESRGRFVRNGPITVEGAASSQSVSQSVQSPSPPLPPPSSSPLIQPSPFLSSEIRSSLS